ncbi:hypothetical protein SCA6_014297 [Theobroma cacao]
MRKHDYKHNNSNHTMFLKHRRGMVKALRIYVDDMIITGNSKEFSNLQKHLAIEFEMKNLKRLKYFLGIEVVRSSQGIFLSQRKYILDLLGEMGMLECKPANTQIVQNHGLREHSNQIPTNRERCCTMNSTILEVFSKKRLTFRKYNNLNVDGFMDANWAGSIIDEKSTSRYFTFELLKEIGYSSSSPMNLFCGNKVAIKIAQNPIQHDPTKHAEVD